MDEGAVQESATSRLALVWGGPGLERLGHAHVVVFGCGGVGSNCIESLARGGVGRLTVIDGDEVAPSNINRQAIAFASTVGRRKVEVTREMILVINPGAEVAALDRFVRAEDVDAVFDEVRAGIDGPIDYVVDAIDTVSAKLAIAAWAERAGTPLISSMGGANKLDPEKLRVCDIFQTENDPLARVMRRECRKRGIRRLTVLSSFEQPRELPVTGARPAGDAGGAGRRPVLGTASYLPPIMGQMIAGHVIRALVAGARQ